MFRPISVYLFLFFAAVNSAHANTDKIHFLVEENPPYNFWKDGEIRGIAVDLLIAITEKSAHPVTSEDIEMIPWARGYKIVQTTPGTALFSMGRTEQREKQFKWVGPISELTIGLMAKKSNNIAINSIEDLAAYRIGTIRDGAPEQLLVTAGYPANKVERVTKPEQNIKKLVIDRIDMLAFNTDSTRYSMKHMGLNSEDYETVFSLKKIKLYYAFNKDTDDATIDRLNLALDQLKKVDANGNCSFDNIISAYLTK